MYLDERLSRTQDVTAQEITAWHTDRVALVIRTMCSFRVLEARLEFYMGLSDVCAGFDPLS